MREGGSTSVAGCAASAAAVDRKRDQGEVACSFLLTATNAGASTDPNRESAGSESEPRRLGRSRKLIEVGGQKAGHAVAIACGARPAATAVDRPESGAARRQPDTSLSASTSGSAPGTGRGRACRTGRVEPEERTRLSVLTRPMAGPGWLRRRGSRRPPTQAARTRLGNSALAAGGLR